MEIITRRVLGLIRAHRVVFGALALWALGPLVAALIQLARDGGVWTGTLGIDAHDQLQYLTWIRDASAHGLASNLWVARGTPHDYLNPLFELSALLVAVGVGVQIAYLLWLPVALVVLFCGCTVYVERFVPAGRGRSAALVLALFYVTPVLALSVWTGSLNLGERLDISHLTFDSEPALALWGFAPTAIAIGLVPVFLLAIERRAVGVASVAGALAAWLHPWQGVLLLACGGVLVVVRASRAPRAPRRPLLRLIVPMLATALPLLYGYVLVKADPSWGAFQTRETTRVGVTPLALLPVFGPLVAVALAGVRRPRDDGELLLLAWVLAAFVMYLVVPEWPPHAFGGVTLPLSVLAVRGWERMQVRGVAAALAAFGLFSLPAAAYVVQTAADERANAAGPDSITTLGPGQAAALAYINGSARSGAVLAPIPLGLTVPALTGHQVYAGHYMWQDQDVAGSARAFFSAGRSNAARARALAADRPAFVIAPCGSPSFARVVVGSVRRFGCVTVYEP